MTFRSRKTYGGLLAIPLLAMLVACNSKDDSEASKIAESASGKAKATGDAVAVAEGQTLGTPMKDRVAVLGLLNKRDGKTRDIELKPGEAIRVGKVVIRLRACEKTAPWETYPDQGAFVQLIVMQRPAGTNDAERWQQVFSGWLFKENPAANVVQHPVYDVWVKECRMSFPGEEDEPSAKPADEGVDKKPSSAPQSPAAKPAPAPAADDEDEPAEEQTIET